MGFAFPDFVKVQLFSGIPVTRCTRHLWWGSKGPKSFIKG